MSDTPNEEQPSPDAERPEAAEAQRGIVLDSIAGGAIIQAANLGAQIIAAKLRDVVAGPADQPAAPDLADAPDDGGFLDS